MPNVVRATQVALLYICTYVCMYMYVCNIDHMPTIFLQVCTATKKKRTCLAGEGVCMYMCPHMGWRRRMYVNVCMGHIWRGPIRLMYMSPRRYMPQKAYVGPRRLMYVYEPTYGPQKAYIYGPICIWAQYVHTYVHKARMCM